MAGAEDDAPPASAVEADERTGTSWVSYAVGGLAGIGMLAALGFFLRRRSD